MNHAVYRKVITRRQRMAHTIPQHVKFSIHKCKYNSTTCTQFRHAANQGLDHVGNNQYRPIKYIHINRLYSNKIEFRCERKGFPGTWRRCNRSKCKY